MPVSFELISPEKILLSGEVSMVVVPGAEGDFGVLQGHAPLISALRPGVIETWENEAPDRRIFVAGGFAEVVGDRCTVLAEEALPVEEIDRETAGRRLAAARESDDATELAAAEAMFAATAWPREGKR